MLFAINCQHWNHS